MQKQIPAQLAAHYAGDALTVCLISRFKLKDGRLFGLTDLDVDVVYDPADYDPGNTGDDWGPIVHKAENGGFDLSRLEHAQDLSVDNAELRMLPGDDSLTPQELLAGVLDSAEVHIYRVNYADLTMGHECVAKGRLGNTRVSDNLGFLEFRSLTDLLKQPEADLVTVQCGAIFGDASTGCPKTYTWTSGTVTAVDPTDSRRVFADNGLAPADDFYTPGVVEWLTGDNAGRQDDIDQNTAGTFALSLPTGFPIQIGDTFRVRQDCTKLWDDADKGCLYHWGADRWQYFRGFPDTPTGDGGSAFVPGAQINAR